MSTTVRKIIDQMDLDLDSTIYKNSRDSFLDYKIFSGDFYDVKDDEQSDKSLQYKNTVNILDFEGITKELEQLLDISYDNKCDLPYFTAGLDLIKNAMQGSEPIAVEGGPCLFERNEVTVEVITKDKEPHYFDFSTGSVYVQKGGELAEENGFCVFVRDQSNEIEEINFVNEKPGLTIQEWTSIKYPFSIAERLGCRVIIPIPDMSYIKYLESVLDFVNPELREETLKKFKVVAFEISDMHIDVINKLRNIYKNVDCTIVHERDKDLISKYYSEREKYMSRRKVMNRLTSIKEKVESIKDYVSMPALPYYLFGINNVLQADCLSETDAFRKCKFAHKGVLNLACMLNSKVFLPGFDVPVFKADKMHKGYSDFEIK